MSNTTSMELSGEGSVESTTTNSTAVQSTLWVFGYGSLIWKTGFPYTRTLIGHIKGYVVRFWQACTYYRGTPEAVSILYYSICNMAYYITNILH